MIDCIAIDDEPKALEIIERYCRKIDFISLKAKFREPVKAVAYLHIEPVNLIFLDINMPDINGMQLLGSIANKPMVVFTTAYNNYAVESYNLNAIDYLLKPITFERFLTACNKAQQQLLLKNRPGSKAEATDTLFIKSGPQTHQVKISEILYLEKEGNYVTLHLKDKNILIRENMADIFDVVPHDGFIRIHKSFVVAIKHISLIEVHQVIINNEKIPVGSTYRDALKLRLRLDQ